MRHVYWQVGIWGGSYGGYMTMRASCMTKRFKAAIAMYGFVGIRGMSCEGGDYTWVWGYKATCRGQGASYKWVLGWGWRC
jgi:hypothetical protein